MDMRLTGFAKVSAGNEMCCPRAAAQDPQAAHLPFSPLHSHLLQDTELAINDVLAENFKRATAVGAR